MKLIILNCDQLKPELEQQFGDYPAMFKQWLEPFLPGYEFERYEAMNGSLPNNIDNTAVYLITGSKASVYEKVNWIDDLSRFIQRCFEAKVFLVGICFGHQLIAQALGGEVKKSNKGWGVGVHTYSIVGDKPWLHPDQKQFNLLVSHQDQVTHLPAQANLFATSDFCLNAGFTVGQHVVTMQAHPEFRLNYAQALLTMRKDIIGNATVQCAEASFKKRIDAELFRQWLINFLHRS